MSDHEDVSNAQPPPEMNDEARRARLKMSPILAALMAACTIAIVWSSAPSATEKAWAAYIGSAVTLCLLTFGLIDLYLYTRRQRTASGTPEACCGQHHHHGEAFIDMLISRNGFV